MTSRLRGCPIMTLNGAKDYSVNSTGQFTLSSSSANTHHGDDECFYPYTYRYTIRRDNDVRLQRFSFLPTRIREEPSYEL